MLTLCSNGHEWKVTYQKFKNGRRCSHCSGLYKEKTKAPTKWDTQKVSEVLRENGYELISENYKNSHTKLKVKCSQSHVNEIYWGHFLKGHRCKICSHARRGLTRRLDCAQVDKELLEIGYRRIGEYSGTDKKLLIICNNNHETEMSLTNIRRGIRCKYCNSSIVERRIMKYLSSLKVSFEKEFSFRNIDTETYMYFDFAVFNSDDTTIDFVIEFDGRHHFEEVAIYDATLEEFQERDRRKNNYCREFNIPLLRIPYTELDNVEKNN